MITSGIQIVQPGQSKSRVNRNPNFPLQGGLKAMGLYPIAMHPVLPGESLKSLSCKTTVVSAPTKSPLSGAWLERFDFYVRLTDIDRTLADMFIGQLNDPTGFQASVDRPQYFTKAGQIDYCYLATKRVVEHYFKDEGQPDRFLTGTDIFETKLIRQDFSESMIKATDVPAPTVSTDADEIAPEHQAFLMMRQMGMQNLSYDEYLRTYGVRSVNVEEGKPELLHYRRYFSQPSNVIDPTTGAPTGAFYWKVDEKADKPKLFKEPGFVISYMCFKPKVYDTGQVSSVSASMWGFADFMPSYTLPDPAAGIEKVSLDNMPFFSATGTDEYYIDRRDLLSHGEQFSNGLGRLGQSSANLRDFSGTEWEARGQYLPSDAGVFADSVDAADRLCDYEGLLTMNIAGHIQDNT